MFLKILCFRKLCICSVCVCVCTVYYIMFCLSEKYQDYQEYGKYQTNTVKKLLP